MARRILPYNQTAPTNKLLICDFLETTKDSGLVNLGGSGALEQKGQNPPSRVNLFPHNSLGCCPFLFFIPVQRKNRHFKAEPTDCFFWSIHSKLIWLGRDRWSLLTYPVLGYQINSSNPERTIGISKKGMKRVSAKCLKSAFLIISPRIPYSVSVQRFQDLN